MSTRRSKPQPNQQQNADNSNISHAPESARPHTPTRHQELQEALDGTGPTMSGSPNERQTPQSPIDDATFTVPTSAEQRPTLQSNCHNAPGVPYFATFQCPSQNPTGATCFPMVQTPTVNATQPIGSLFFMFAFLPVAPIDICHHTPPTTTPTEVPRHSDQLHRDSDPTQFTHREQSYLRTSGPMGTHEPQTPEKTPVPHSSLHSVNGNDGISMMTDLNRVSQDRNLSNLSEGQFVDISLHNRHLGQRQGNILTSTNSVNRPSSPLETTRLNHQRSGSSPHRTHNTNMGPTTYSSQYLGNISSVIDSSRLPPSAFSDFSTHNHQSLFPSGFDIQNYATRSTPSTGQNVRNISNPCNCEHVHETSSVTDPINYAVNSRTRSSSGPLTWAPTVTSTPISSGKTLTSRRLRTEDICMSPGPRRLPPLPIFRRTDFGLLIPEDIPCSRPERVARPTTLPTEEELRDIIARAMAYIQTSQETVMSRGEGHPNAEGYTPQENPDDQDS